MRSFKSNENIHKKEGGSYYVVSANKASSNKDSNGNSIWNYGTNLSKGVSILFNKSNVFNVIAKDNFENGRVTSIKLEMNDHKIQILNIYAPNNSVHRKHFTINLSTLLDNEFSYILGGDFNCTQDNHIDRDPNLKHRD